MPGPNGNNDNGMSRFDPRRNDRTTLAPGQSNVLPTAPLVVPAGNDQSRVSQAGNAWLDLNQWLYGGDAVGFDALYDGIDSVGSAVKGVGNWLFSNDAEQRAIQQQAANYLAASGLNAPGVTVEMLPTTTEGLIAFQADVNRKVRNQQAGGASATPAQAPMQPSTSATAPKRLDPTTDPYVAPGAPEWMYYQGGTPGNPTGVPTNDVTLPDGRTVPMSSPEANAAYGTIPVPGMPDGWFQVTGQPPSPVRRTPAPAAAPEPLSASEQLANLFFKRADTLAAGLTPEQQAWMDERQAAIDANVYQPSAANQQRLDSALGQLLTNTQGASSGIDAAFLQGIAQVDANTAAAQQQADATAAQLGDLYAAGLGNIAAGVQGASQNAGQAVGMQGLAIAPSTAGDLAGLMVAGSARDQAMAQNLGDVFAGSQGLISSGMSAEQAAQQSALVREAQAQEATFRRDYLALEAARQDAIESENRQAARDLADQQLGLIMQNQADAEELMRRGYEIQYGPQVEAQTRRAIAEVDREQAIEDKKLADSWKAADSANLFGSSAAPEAAIAALNAIDTKYTDDYFSTTTGPNNTPVQLQDANGEPMKFSSGEVRSAVTSAMGEAMELLNTTGSLDQARQQYAQRVSDLLGGSAQAAAALYSKVPALNPWNLFPPVSVQ